MSRIRRPAVAAAFGLLLCAQSFPAQEQKLATDGHRQTPARGDVVLQGLIQPEIETLSLTASCFSHTFSFTIVNHRLRPSALGDARREGRPPRDPESTAGLRRFLAESREVRFQGATCVSENEIGIGLAGLLFSPPPGQRDDVMRGFRIRF